MASILILLLVGASLDVAPAAPGHDVFQELLARFVGADQVDYGAWKNDERALAALSGYVDRLEETAPDQLARDDQLAYWINLYNAATLELVLSHYPVASIRDIGGPEDSPWKQPLVRVGESELSLDQIENEIIRPRFQDPRIHFALNCAARSCPPLRDFAFDGTRLHEQLDRVTREALRSPRIVDASECGSKGGLVRLNRIFEWYAADFGDLRAFLASQMEEQPASARLAGCEIEFLPYDWALNE